MKSLNERESRKKSKDLAQSIMALKQRSNHKEVRGKLGKCDVLEVKYPKKCMRGREGSGMVCSADRPVNMKTETWPQDSAAWKLLVILTRASSVAQWQ